MADSQLLANDQPLRGEAERPGAEGIHVSGACDYGGLRPDVLPALHLFVCVDDVIGSDDPARSSALLGSQHDVFLRRLQEPSLSAE